MSSADEAAVSESDGTNRGDLSVEELRELGRRKAEAEEERARSPSRRSEAARRAAEQEEAERRVENQIKNWSQVLREWEAGAPFRPTKRIRQLCWKGIPPILRGRVWPYLIGNELHVNKELFDIFRQHAKDLKKAARQREDQQGEALRTALSSPSREGTAEDTDACNAENCDWDGSARGSVSEEAAPAAGGGSPSGDLLPGQPVQVLGKEDSLLVIEMDLHRTLPDLAFFQEGGPLSSGLRDVLEAFVCYRPDVGYVQGMSFLAAMLLLQMDPAPAFQCLANLVVRRSAFAFYNMDQPQTAPRFRAFSLLLPRAAPRAAEALDRTGAQPDMVLMNWLMTLFLRGLPLEVAARLWDIYLLEGDAFLWRACLGIFRLLEKRFAEADDLEDIMRLLQGLSDDEMVNPEAVVRCIAEVKLSEEQFLRLVRQCETEANPDPGIAGSIRADVPAWIARPFRVFFQGQPY